MKDKSKQVGERDCMKTLVLGFDGVSPKLIDERIDTHQPNKICQGLNAMENK